MNTRQSHMYDILRIVALGLLVIGLASCGQATPEATSAVTVPTEASNVVTVPTETQNVVTVPTEVLPTPMEPAKEMVLRIGHPDLDNDWSPLRGGGTSVRLLSLWWAPPMYFDSESELHPFVISEWASNEDNTVWTFKLNPDAVFSDGSPITAEDVKGTWDLMAHPTTKHQRIDQIFGDVQGFDDVYIGNAKEMSGLVVKDSSTIEVRLSSPNPIFYMGIATNLVSPVKISQALGPDGEEKTEWWHPKNNVVVSGPFMPVSMDLDAGVYEFVRNPNFFGPTPKLDRVIITVVEDSQTQVTMLQNGELDAASSLSTPTLTNDLGADFVSGTLIPKGYHFFLNTANEPTNDINIRKALIMAVDTKALYEATFPDGPHSPAGQILNAVPGVDPNYVDFPYDPEAAKAALAASSYGSAENLPVLMFVGISKPARQVAAQYIAEQWRQVLGIDRVEMKADIDEYEGPDQARIQIFRDDIGARVPDAVVYLRGTIHSSSSYAKDKMGGYKNAEVDRLLDEAATLSTDDPNRILLAQQAQKLFREDWMYIPWYYNTESKLAMPYVMNWIKNLDWQVYEPWNVFLEDH